MRINEYIIDLSSPELHKRQAASTALAQLAHNNAENQMSIVDLGGIALLVQLLNHNDTQLKQNVTYALCNLAINKASRAAIIEIDGGLPLVRLLRDEDAIVKRNTLLALDKLTNQFDGSTRTNPGGMTIVDAEGIAILIHCLNDDDSFTKTYAAKILGNIAEYNNKNIAEIVDNGGILPLIRLLNDATRSVREAAVSALLDITSVAKPDIQASIVKLGGVESLVRLLDDESISYLAASVIENLARYNLDNRIQIVRAGAVVPLVRLLNHSYPNWSVVRALTALANDNIRGQYLIAEAGGILPLVRLLSVKVDTLADRAAEALCALAENYLTNKKLIISAGAVPALQQYVDEHSVATPYQIQIKEKGQALIAVLQQVMAQLEQDQAQQTTPANSPKLRCFPAFFANTPAEVAGTSAKQVADSRNYTNH